MVSILGCSEIILSDISLYKLHHAWTHTFLCHETKNLVNLYDDCLSLSKHGFGMWLLLQGNFSLVLHQYLQYDNVSEKVYMQLSMSESTRMMVQPCWWEIIRQLHVHHMTTISYVIYFICTIYNKCASKNLISWIFSNIYHVHECNIQTIQSD